MLKTGPCTVSSAGSPAAVHPVRRRQHPGVLDAEGPAEAVDRLDLSPPLAPYSLGRQRLLRLGPLNQTLRHYPFLQNLLVMMIEADGLQGWLAQLEAVEAQQKKHEAGGMAVPELVATAATPLLEQRPSRALLLDQVLGLMLLTVSP